MQPVSGFRGAGGEMVRVYVSPQTYFTAIPIATLAMVLTAGLGALGESGVYLAAPALYFLYVLALMRTALPASRGELEPSNDFGEIISYACRYVVVTIATLIPVAAAVAGILKFGGDVLPAWGLTNPFDLKRVGILGIILLLLLVFAALLPSLSLLIVLRHGSLREAFSAAAWRWLLVDRQEDILPLYCFLFGGAIIMVGASAIPAIILLFMALEISLEAVGYVSSALYALGGSTAPILLGLMAGAFVANENPAVATVSTSGGPAISPKIPAATKGALVPPVAQSDPAPTVQEPRPDVKIIEEHVNKTPEPELHAYLAVVSEKEHETPLLAAVEKTLLRLRTGDRKGALEAASTGAELAGERGFADISVYLFTKLGEDRMRLSVEPKTLELMGKLLEQRLVYMDAAWCFHTAAVKVGDLLKAQKRLFQTAENALKEGKLKEAQALFELLLRKYPESNLGEFARQGMDRVRKLAKM